MPGAHRDKTGFFQHPRRRYAWIAPGVHVFQCFPVVFARAFVDAQHLFHTLSALISACANPVRTQLVSVSL